MGHRPRSSRPATTAQGAEQDTEHEAQDFTPQDTGQVTDHVELLVAPLTREMGRAQLQSALRLAHRDHFTATYLRPALEAGLIEMTLPAKATSRNQRYRRTAAGEALAQHAKAKDSSA